MSLNAGPDIQPVMGTLLVSPWESRGVHSWVSDVLGRRVGVWDTLCIWGLRRWSCCKFYKENAFLQELTVTKKHDHPLPFCSALNRTENSGSQRQVLLAGLGVDFV